MIDYEILRALVLEAIKDLRVAQVNDVTSRVQRLVGDQGLFPTEEECRELGVDYARYREQRLNHRDELNVNQIIWDLIIDRVITAGRDTQNPDLPGFRVTEFGNLLLEQGTPTYYNPDGYISDIERSVPNLDPVIRQYVAEGLNCFRQRLFFAAAVMFGAAAETAVLILLQSITDSTKDTQRKRELVNLLDRRGLPAIFEGVREELDRAIQDAMPYSVHEGSKEHLLSLFESIRVQRNDAVHPAAGQVEKNKVFLTIQSFPAALELVYRLVVWFQTR